jgi:hypothetical protein
MVFSLLLYDAILNRDLLPQIILIILLIYLAPCFEFIDHRTFSGCGLGTSLTSHFPFTDGTTAANISNRDNLITNYCSSVFSILFLVASREDPTNHPLVFAEYANSDPVGAINIIFDT